MSIYGRALDEWEKLAAWVVDHKLFSHNVRWLVQIPRLFHVYKAEGRIENFEQVVINVFQPLFEVTKRPESHPKLYVFLQRVVGFDSVDDESKTERRLHRKFPTAKEWNTLQNPPYTYWIYYLFANMASLNVFRKQRGFNTFVLRPHCGEAGDLEHLEAAALCCHSINHGLTLRKAPLLQYIFYLDQIGIAMSPLSNNALFLTYERNPFLKYFRRGLNVSLSTDDPLQISFTKEPLIEEYAVAAQIYKLSPVDMCELAAHSVRQSGFEHQLKQRWLGDDYDLPGVRGNSVAKSNVPDIREQFRQDTLTEQLEMQVARLLAQRGLTYENANQDSRIERYARPPVLSQTSPSTMASQSPIQLARINSAKFPSPPIPARLLTTQLSPLLSQTTVIDNDTTKAEPDRAEHQHKDLTDDENNRPPRSSSLTMISPSASASAMDTPYWHAQPKIFPGLVHEQTRNTSLRSGSGSGSGSATDLALAVLAGEVIDTGAGAGAGVGACGDHQAGLGSVHAQPQPQPQGMGISMGMEEDSDDDDDGDGEAENEDS